jgi:hypothetical protein
VGGWAVRHTSRRASPARNAAVCETLRSVLLALGAGAFERWRAANSGPHTRTHLAQRCDAPLDRHRHVLCPVNLIQHVTSSSGGGGHHRLLPGLQAEKGGAHAMRVSGACSLDIAEAYTRDRPSSCSCTGLLAACCGCKIA